MEKFRLKGILYPGRVDIHKRGIVVLGNISDDLAEQLWKEGCPYLEPTPAGRTVLYPGEKPIEVKPIKKKRVSGS
ncbi:MAG: hypothetical protein UY18_C0036G0003 [Microgenomates group bacterium GW2011_GWF2_47_9]|nr:MAG: hypothetical protein UY18_C0036G0003 [Microgenomates group bacterium GW2011_GWF2_47_9]